MAALIVPDRSHAPLRPALVALRRLAGEPTAAPHRPSAATFARRRLVVAALLLVALWSLVSLFGAVRSLVAQVDAAPATLTAGAGPAPASALPGTVSGSRSTDVGPPAAAESVYVVRSGDTLWKIASAVRPDSDPRAVVDVLAERTAGAIIQPGEEIDLSGLP